MFTHMGIGELASIECLPRGAGGTSLVAQELNNLPRMQETRVRSLGQEDLQEKGMVTHSSILTWRNPWTEKPGGL